MVTLKFGMYSIFQQHFYVQAKL